jgi:ribose/xylose/arabinose/galactoside ABC-type transport system permease subunit
MTVHIVAPEPGDSPLGDVLTHRSFGSLSSLIRRSAAGVVLIVTLVFGVIVFGSQFANTGNVTNLAVASSFLAIISIGMTFVILGGGIDLSVGSVYALAAVLAAYGSRWGSLAGIVVPIVTCGAIGMVQGTLIGKLRMPAFIVTLAGLLFARGLAFKVSDDGNTTHLIDRGRWMTNLGQERVFGVGVPVWVALALFAAGLVLLNRTRLGQALYAIGGSEDAARLMGLPVARVKVILYTMTGLLSGLAGMLVAARSSSGLSTIGSGLELEAIAAVVIGGTLLSGGAGGLTGTLIGVVLLGVIQNLINQVGTLRSFHQQVVSGVFLIVVVTAQTIIGRKEQS